MRVAALGHLGLGSLTQAEVQKANSWIETLSAKITEQHQIIGEAQAQGFTPAQLRDLKVAQQGLLQRLQELQVETGNLESARFADWIARARNLGEAIDGQRVELQRRLSASSPRSMGRIVAYTVVAVGGVAGLFWLVNRWAR